jgi:hypothetical protein
MILKELGYLQNLEFKDNKLFSIAMDETGCCMDYIDFNKVYKISYRHQDADVTLTYLSSAIQNTWFPDEYFATPIRFEVLNSLYKMRAEPMIDDTSKNRVESLGERRKGNVVDTLNKGARGRAIASHTDNTGRVWWLVEVDRDYNDYGHLFYEEDNDNTRKATKMGWISSRYVKKLNE